MSVCQGGRSPVDVSLDRRQRQAGTYLSDPSQIPRGGLFILCILISSADGEEKFGSHHRCRK